MDRRKIDAALRDATDTDYVTIGSGVTSSVADLFADAFGDATAVVVADGNTFAVAGEAVHEGLQGAGRALEEPHVFPGRPTLYAGYDNATKLADALRAHDAVPVAVGSGSLNDIVKRAAHEVGRPYLCVATAASMDGYTAFGASISKDGQKQTLSCPAPRAVLADLDVLVGAPKEMTASGYADLLGKVTAGADWIAADALGAEPIDRGVWSLVQDPLRGWTHDPAGLRAGDEQATEALVEGLILSGLAMQAHQSSRPASGAEHQFSHLWEMEGLGRDGDPPLSHGFKVGVGSVAIAALYERILERDLTNLDTDTLAAAWPSEEELEASVRAAHTVPEIEAAAVKESLAKHPDADALASRLETLRRAWPELREELASQLMAAAELREMLRQAGCPTAPEEIGLSRRAFEATYTRARTIRRRYTVLDLAAEAGILEDCVAELFAPGGFWAEAGDGGAS